VTTVELTTPPPVPVIVTLYVPVALPAGTLKVTREVPVPAAIGLVPKLTLLSKTGVCRKSTVALLR